MEEVDPDDCTIGPAAMDENDEPKKSLLDDYHRLPKEIRNIVAGGLAGMLAKTVVAPFDRIKILYQISSAHFHIRDVPSVARKIVLEEGLPALWKGNTATMIRVFPYSGIQFMVFDRCKSWFLREQERTFLAERRKNPNAPKPKWGLTPLESLGSGMVAGVVSVIATYPLDLTRAQLAVLRRKKEGKAKNMGFSGVLAENYTKRGASGLFRGITPTIMGILPYSGAAFSLNEQGKRQIAHMTGREVTTLERMQCGALAGLIGQSLTYPFEVTRRRMQTLGVVPTKGNEAAVSFLSSTNGGTKPSSTTMPQQPPTLTFVMMDLYREQGIRGFFKGVSMNWFKGPIAFSISFTAYDTIQSYTETVDEKKVRLMKRFATVARGSGGEKK